MFLKDFLQLTYDEQIAMLTSDGIFIGKRGKRPRISILYQLHTFYVEILYRTYRMEICSIRCTTSTVILDAYFERMDDPLLMYEFRIT